MNNRQVTIYACGGAGINITRQFAGVSLPESLNVQPPELYYIDSSASNLNKPGIELERVFLYEGRDGSGGDRGENNPIIGKTMLKVLEQFKPSVFNIVVSSASGGTGAVIAHHLVSELKKQKQQVVLMFIGSTDSRKRIENTVAALRSLDKAAEMLDSPIVVHYLENSTESPRAEIDLRAVGALTALVGLFGGVHDELDSTDLRKWLTHVDLHPEAYSLQIAHGREEASRALDVISVATLAAPGTDTTLDPIPAYQTVGFVNEVWAKQIVKSDAPVSFLLSSEMVDKASKALTDRLGSVKREHMARVRRDSLADDDAATNDGMYL